MCIRDSPGIDDGTEKSWVACHQDMYRYGGRYTAEDDRYLEGYPHPLDGGGVLDIGQWTAVLTRISVGQPMQPDTLVEMWVAPWGQDYVKLTSKLIDIGNWTTYRPDVFEAVWFDNLAFGFSGTKPETTWHVGEVITVPSLSRRQVSEMERERYGRQTRC